MQGRFAARVLLPPSGLVWLAAAAAVLWLALVVLAPVLPPALAAAVYALGSLVCHQRPERSFHLAGAQLAVCARCTGIYVGACAAAVLAPMPASRYARCFSDGRIARLVLGAATLPTLVTVSAEWTGLWTPSSLVRAIAGVALGVGAALVVSAGLSTITPRDAGSAGC